MYINRRISELLVAATLALLDQSVCAQSILEFDGWMQKIDRRNQSVQGNLARKDAPAASTDAREIGDLYQTMETYFTRRGNAANAVKLSKEGKEFAATVVRSVAANDFAAASQAALAIAHACRTCHLEYKPLE
jgi:hypothetical protein